MNSVFITHIFLLSNNCISFTTLVAYASKKLRLHWPKGVGRDKIVNSTGLKATEYELTDYHISQKLYNTENTGKLNVEIL